MARKKVVNRDLFGHPIEEPAPDPALHISPTMEKYREYVDGFTVEQLQRVRTCLGFDFRKGNKDALVSATLGFFSFLEEEEHFREWFEALPPYLARAIEEATFKGHIEAGHVEKMAGKSVSTRSRNYYTRYQQTNPELRLGIFDLYQNYGRQLLFMNPFVRKLMTALLPKPPHYVISPCVGPESSGWSAEETLSEPMPLMLRSIERILTDHGNYEKILRRGLNKRDIKEARKNSAYPAFPVGAKTGVDPIDLIARFLMIDPEQLTAAGKRDVREFIKELVTTFLIVPPSGKIRSHYFWIDSCFEYSVLSPHVSKASGIRLDRSLFQPHPWARTIFYQILKVIAGSGGWYDMDEAAESIRMQALSFSFLRNTDNAPAFIVKGEELILPEGTIKTDGWVNGFSLDIYLTHALITRPLLKGYGYLMASLGLLEIEEEEPEKLLKKNGTFSPVSPFDGLTRVRVTSFGAWCLGISEEKPELPPVHYEAIADRRLPLVTYRGQSVECKVFLERIGDPIGEDRFRISEASFIRDCRNEEDIEHRVAEFHRLIARDPADHWNELFSRIRDRSRLFEHEEPCMMIKLPAERDVRRLFIEEKKLSSLVVRAEGGRIVVPQRNYNKLRKALEAYGVLKG